MNWELVLFRERVMGRHHYPAIITLTHDLLEGAIFSLQKIYLHVFSSPFILQTVLMVNRTLFSPLTGGETGATVWQVASTSGSPFLLTMEIQCHQHPTSAEFSYLPSVFLLPKGVALMRWCLGDHEESIEKWCWRRGLPTPSPTFSPHHTLRHTSDPIAPLRNLTRKCLSSEVYVLALFTVAK